MIQDAWLFSLSKIEWKTVKDKDLEDREYAVLPNISQLEDDERQKVIEKMKNYWKEHKSSSLEFLVNDAIVNCDKGSIMSRVKGKDHGVYTDKQGGQALLNEDDRKLKTTDHIVFGCCSLEDKEDNKCKAKKFTKWYGVNSKVYIGEGTSSLIMSSYMICPYHKNAYIKPVTSGQEFTFTDSLFEYPKFVVERGEKHAYFKMEYWNKYDFKQAEINMKVIRKLAIRNISILAQDIEGVNTKGYYERKWIEYLAKFMLLCEDKGILCNIINEFYGKADFSESEVLGKSILLENYNLLLRKAKSICQSILKENSYRDDEEVTRTIENYFLMSKVRYLNVYVVLDKEKTIKSIETIGTIDKGIKKYYENGIDIQYWTYDPLAIFRTVHTYISGAKINNTTVGYTSLWEYFSKGSESLFVGLLILNIAATAAIIAIPSVAAIVGLSVEQSENIASVVWTVGGSFLGEKLEGDATKKFDKIKYRQSRASLVELLSQIKAYTIYSNRDEDVSTFSYEVYQSDKTEFLINNFLDNISRIYIKQNEKATSRRSLMEILELGNVIGRPLMIKINALIAALTIENITNKTIFGIEYLKDEAITGMVMLERINKLTIKSTTYWVGVYRNNEVKIIDEDHKVNVSQLFEEVI